MSHATSASAAHVRFNDSAVEGLRSSVRGQLLRPGDDTYDSARRVFNAMIDRRPALILRCAGASDVVHGVNFAREHNLAISVRGGGHSVAERDIHRRDRRDRGDRQENLNSCFSSSLRALRSLR